MADAPENDSLVEVPLDSGHQPTPPEVAQPPPTEAPAAAPTSTPPPVSPARVAEAAVRGQVVAGEEPEEEEEEPAETASAAADSAVTRNSSQNPESVPTSGASLRSGRARPRQNTEELKSARERLERHHAQRKVLHAHNKGVRDALLAQLLGRLTTGKAVCEDLVAYLKSQAGYDAEAAAQHRKAGEQLEANGRQHPEVGTLRRCVEALATSSSVAHTHFTSISDAVRTDSLKRLQQLIVDLEGRTKAIKEDAAKAAKGLTQHVDKVNGLYKDYQQAVSLAESGAMVEADPYIAGVQYEAALAELKDVERAFGETLSTLVQEVDRLDRSRLDTLRAILADYVQNRTKALEGVLTGLKDASLAIDAISGDDFLAYSLGAQKEIAALKPDADLSPYNFDAAGLDPAALRERCGQLPSLLETMADALAPVEGQVDRDLAEDVVREGWLKLKGGLLKPKKPVYVQLTRHGFLHFFASKGGAVPETSVALVKCEVETEKDEHSFCVQVKRVGMQVLGKEKHHLQADSQELMVEWICAIKDCTQDA
eukprot:EG_transcript_6167